MSYGEFIKELPSSLKRQIIAYDNLPNHEGCILYFRGGPRRIDVDVHAFDLDRAELVELLFELCERSTAGGRQRITLKEGRLVAMELAGPELDQAAVACED